MYKRFTCLSCALLLLLLAGPVIVQCEQAADKAPTQTESSKKESGENVVLSKIGDIEITGGEVLEMVTALSKRMQRSTLPSNNTREFFSNALTTCTDGAIIRATAKKQGIVCSASDIDEKIKEISKQFPSEEQFKKMIAAQGMTDKLLRNNIRDKILFDQLVDKNVEKDSPPTDDEIKEFYDKNPKFFQEQEQVRASHILLMTKKEAPPEEKDKIKKKLEGIVDDIKAEKITFEDAAKQYSDDKGSGQQGGDLNYFTRGRMVPPFEKAAFETPVGEMSGIVESQFGYHVIKVVDHKEGRTVPLEEAKEKISTYLSDQSHAKSINLYLKMLRETTEVEVLVSAEDWLKQYAPESPDNAGKKPSNTIQIDPNLLKK